MVAFEAGKAKSEKDSVSTFTAFKILIASVI